MEGRVGAGAIFFHMQGGSDDDLRKIAIANLDAWKQSGVVKTLMHYSAEDASALDVCSAGEPPSNRTA